MLYQHLGRPYNMPFAGIRILTPDYLRLVSDLREYMALPLEFEGERGRHNGVSYPIGRIGDVTIWFIHYQTEVGAGEKWKRRTDRMDFDNLYVKLNAGREGCTPETIARFSALPFERKLALSKEPLPGCVTVPGWCGDAFELFVRSQQVFDAVAWIAGESTQPTTIRRLAFRAAAKPLGNFDGSDKRHRQSGQRALIRHSWKNQRR